jgi:hypothetical protein
LFTKEPLPSATLGKGFAECFWHSAKCLNPVVVDLATTPTSTAGCRTIASTRSPSLGRASRRRLQARLRCRELLSIAPMPSLGRASQRFHQSVCLRWKRRHAAEEEVGSP